MFLVFKYMYQTPSSFQKYLSGMKFFSVKGSIKFNRTQVKIKKLSGSCLIRLFYFIFMYKRENLL